MLNNEPLFRVEFTGNAALLPQMVSLFADSLSLDYISHGELQGGRALTEKQWSPKLCRLIERDLLSAMQSSVKPLIAMCEHSLVGIAIMSIHHEPPSYAVVEDIVISSGYRNAQLGTMMVKKLEALARSLRVERMFLESGVRNSNAHRFFERLGFGQCSVVMAKSLADSNLPE